MMKTSNFDYDLPPELIAQHPPEKREDARLLILNRETGKIEHRRFPDILDFFQEGDLLLLNDARVIPARLYGRRPATGGKAEVLLLHPADKGGWSALIRPARRARPGTKIDFGERIIGVVRERLGGKVIIDFPGTDNLLEAIEEIGFPPLPPYIKRDRKNYPEKLRTQDRERYQTVFAKKPGAVAAPTAGLHFTEELLNAIRERGVETASVTLYVGYGTFQPVKAETVEEHRMHEEYFEISPETADRINSNQGRLWVVGTTTVRALESAADGEGIVKPTTAPTDIFIYPGYRFKTRFNLITNFHFPRSTLIMLVSALAGRNNIMKAYREAIKENYRFYSYGDAMLLGSDLRNTLGINN
ncbi:MAG: tRNA preQ1(34) S-adenosylmethionine ribosyltransferase-isomerase QueA [Candidatus Euphemobacter frigidus]|nr:tRNA preQ1(34) S-adenosylmethionine ribosyltransferase-isomerase QueA [Candidatus Euphemobacter frigidus]MDP8275947.1 tRNA preQ1(34) S-adenosylmethionine ribosyltransferase-isomerase QueA [Candidatus Euphemobacter frigidus]